VFKGTTEIAPWGAGEDGGMTHAVTQGWMEDEEEIWVVGAWSGGRLWQTRWRQARWCFAATDFQ